MEKQSFRIKPFIDRRDDNDQEKILAGYLESINGVRVHAVTVHEMQRYGFDAMKLSEGIQICQAAQADLAILTATLDSQQLKEARLANAFSYAGQCFLEYRNIAQTLIKDKAVQKQFGLNGKVPGDLLQFINVAYFGYKVANNSQVYLQVLQQFGDVKCLLDIGCSSLAELISADKANERAKGVAIDARIDFDEAIKRAKDWMKAFRKAAKLACKHQPALSQEIALG